MSEEIDSGAGEDDLADGLEQKKTSGKKIIIIAVAVVVILAIAAGAYFFFMAGGDDHADDPNNSEEAAKLIEEEATELLFLELDPMLINLDTAGGKPKYLKLTISLEVDKQTSLDDLNKKNAPHH